MAIPNFQDLYNLFESTVTSDPDTDVTDFSAASLYDAFAMIAASASQAIIRNVGQDILALFVATAEGADLTKLVRDRYGIERQANETDAELRSRVLDWLEYNGAATPAALLFYAEVWTAGTDSATVEEDTDAGAATLEVTVESGQVVADVEEDLEGDLDYWRPLNVPVNLKVS